ncbi:MAG: hypothetical protein KatS3mg035_0380 [Bacteroidia bacterium]|nr:MAG: hypothetical protein KatS3mg035_0380 [Bacteroidia bacterium]
MKLYLKTLSLLHISSGENLEVFNYVVSGDYFFRISDNIFLEFLEKKQLAKEYMEYAAQIFGEQVKKIIKAKTTKGKN